MMDSQEEKVAQNTELEATQNSTTEVENKVEEDVATENGDAAKEDLTQKIYENKAEVIARLKEIASSDELSDRAELDHLKAAFYKLHLADNEAKEKQYLADGGDPEAYRPEPDEDEVVFKAEISLIKEKRAKYFEQQKAEKEENLKRKEEIIEKIKNMATSPDEANKSYKDFKALQDEWKQIGAVPPEKANELWRNYHLYTEQFYDLLNLNREAREYDFKKNLEAKTKLCEAAEKLGESEDTVSAFHQLQELHQQYREIGPVEKELREKIWARFKAASTIVNKRHQEHFDNLRAKEEENLKLKTDLCEKAEAISKEENASARDWDRHTNQMLDLQAEWKKIGFAPQKFNTMIFERFRAACDVFFKGKAEFFKDIKEQFAENVEKKKALIAKANEMKDETDWKQFVPKMTELQKQWKTIGATPHKIGDQLWKEFNEACNKFFEARNAANAGARDIEKQNLQQKRDVIEELQKLLEEKTDDVKQKVQELIEKYNQIGHVPFRDKDKLYKEYHDLLDKIYNELHVSIANKKLDNFRNTIKNVAKKGEDALDNERARLMRQYEEIRQQVQTYENNLGFLTASSKKGNTLIDSMNRKITKLKDDMKLVREKIKEIDKNLKEEME